MVSVARPLRVFIFTQTGPPQQSASEKSNCKDVFGAAPSLQQITSNDCQQPPAATHHFSLVTGDCQDIADKLLGLCDRDLLFMQLC